jgi:peptide/nickel transport system permease protein
MFRYILRRLLIMPILLIGVTMLIFLMLSMLTPYERASLYVADIPKRQGAIEGIIEKYGLDEPIPAQYWNWMVGRKDADTGEVGTTTSCPIRSCAFLPSSAGRSRPLSLACWCS